MPATNRTPRVVKETGDERRSKGTYGWFSLRGGDLFAFKGALQLDFLTVTSLDPRVVGFTRIVPRLQWFDGDRWQVHEPALGVLRQIGDAVRTSYFDVRWSNEVEANAGKYERLAEDAASRKLSYKALSEREVRVQPRLDNARIVLSQAGKHIVPVADEARLAEFVRARRSFTLNEAVQGTGLSYSQAYTAVLNRVALGHFEFDFGMRFRPDAALTNLTVR